MPMAARSRINSGSRMASVWTGRLVGVRRHRHWPPFLLGFVARGRLGLRRAAAGSSRPPAAARRLGFGARPAGDAPASARRARSAGARARRWIDVRTIEPHRRLDLLEDRPRVDADRHDQEHQRRQAGDLVPADGRQTRGRARRARRLVAGPARRHGRRAAGLAQRAEDDPAEHPEQVVGAQDHAGRRQHARHAGWPRRRRPGSGTRPRTRSGPAAPPSPAPPG